MGMLNAAELIQEYKTTGLPSFDIGGGNVDFIEAAFQSALRAGKGMYLSSTPATVQSYLGFDGYVKAIKLIAERYPQVNYAIHLDHSKELSFVKAALEAGYSSVMFDGSDLNFSDNVSKTRQAIEMAEAYGATVEAELGTIGGKEDELEGRESDLPSLGEVVEFAKETRALLVAPAVGTVHGHFKGKPQLNWPVIEALKEQNEYFFVLHGCTGLELETLRRVALAGFVKFNFATSLREAFKEGMMDHIQNHPSDIKPFAYLKAGRQSLTEHMDQIFSTLNLESSC